MGKRFSIILILCLGGNFWLQVQAAGKGKKPCTYKNAIEVVKEGDLSAYRCDKEWGVYNHKTGKEIAKPGFSYVLLSPYGFLGIKNNLIGYYAANGKTIIEPKYTQLGFVWNNASSNEFLFFLNDTVKAAAAVTDPLLGKYVKRLTPYAWTGNHLHNLHCRVLEVKNGKVVVNNYDFNYTPDTIYEEMPQSGLYDPANAKWLIPRVNKYLVSFGNTHVGLVSTTREEFPQAFNYRVYDENYKSSDIVADLATHLIPVSEIHKLLPFANVTNVE
ncbi:MAG: hypothetical protein ACHQF2_06145, partial [Flavobacteriales bacterium]